MGRVLSQSEIDNLLSNLLNDATVLPESDSSGGSDAGITFNDVAQPTDVVEDAGIPAGIAAFKAKIAAAQAERQSATAND